MKLYIIFILLLLFFILQYNNSQIENFSNYKSPCGNYSELLKKVFEERHMKEDITNYDIFIPCSYNSCESDVLAFENKTTNKKIFLIDGCDWVASKMALWELNKVLLAKRGSEKDLAQYSTQYAAFEEYLMEK